MSDFDITEPGQYARGLPFDQYEQMRAQPGLVWHEGELWVSYYSSHEGSSRIYVARVRL